MRVIRYNPGMQIVNTEQLAKGTGAKYLEVLVPKEEGPLVAVAWRRVLPKKSLPITRALIQFKD